MFVSILTCSIRQHCVPFPAPGPPKIKTAKCFSADMTIPLHARTKGLNCSFRNIVGMVVIQLCIFDLEPTSRIKYNLLRHQSRKSCLPQTLSTTSAFIINSEDRLMSSMTFFNSLYTNSDFILPSQNSLSTPNKQLSMIDTCPSEVFRHHKVSWL